jgi:hypothetical protein
MAPSAFFNVTKIADGNVFISAVEYDKFTGTFKGNGEGVFTLQIHPEGFTTGQGRTLFTGKVSGKKGTLAIQWVGNTKNEKGWWLFEWVILSGTGKLANLQGQGTGWGPGPAGLDVWGGADMSGKIVFALIRRRPQPAKPSFSLFLRLVTLWL